VAYYRLCLELNGPLSTPLESGTIFGHLCWALRLLDGEAALSRWLENLEASPFELSDGFPSGFLPRPVVRPSAAQPRDLTEARQYKDAKKRAWIPVHTFLALQGTLSEQNLIGAAEPEEKLKDHRVAHNRIDRRTGTTPQDGGGLYFSDEWWPSRPGAYRADVYVRTSEPRDGVLRLFQKVGEMGFGKDATLGRGQFSVTIAEPDRALFELPGNRRMSLSRGTISANMHEVRYRVQTRYGRLGGLYAIQGSPFKRPVTLTRPGATFRPEGEGPFGELLKGIHPSRGEIVENAWHLTVPYNEAPSAR
jgi:CRISPR-associated protein Csm4